MAGSPFAKSKSKRELMEKLGLSGADGEYIYNLLYQEATAGRDRLSVNPSALTHQSVQEGVLPPYKWDNLTETYRYYERRNIVALASAQTAPYYRKGQFGTQQDNWVADWFLWHSFRFRNRNPAAAQPVNGIPGAGRGNGGAAGASVNPYFATVLH